MVHIGLKIKELMEQEKLDIPFVAEKLGKSRQAVYDMLNKEDLNTGLLKQFSEILNVPLMKFVEEKGEIVGTIEADESRHSIPYYEHLLVTAGENGALLTDKENPTGYVNLPAVTGKYCFPVIGCSMEPEIRAGEIVIADDVYSWDRIDPDKVYLIITHEDRMIKHLEVDQEDDSILWCVSPNYKRFSIMKQDIKRIFKITFHGRLV